MTTPIQISIQHGDEQHDIEVFPEMTAAELAAAVLETYGWNRDDEGNLIYYRLQDFLRNRWLQEDETLAQAKIWTGALILFHPQPVQAPRAAAAQPGGTTAPSQAIPAAPAKPMAGWRPLFNPSSGDAPFQDGSAEDNDPTKNWKRLD
jgi:hypothetical protein